MRPRILMLATTRSYRAGAFVEAARRLGADLVVGSERPQALAFIHPHGHLTLDFADPLAARDSVLRFAGEARIDAVVAADDDGTLVAALAARGLGLEHASFPAVYRTRSKHRLREALRAAGLPSPWFSAVSVDDDPEVVARRALYPCVLKPVHLSASRGVVRANDADELVAAVRRVSALVCRPDTPRLWTASDLLLAEYAGSAPDDAGPGGAPVSDTRGREPELLIEEYLPGVEVALEGLLERGALRVLAIFDKPDPLEGPLFEESIYVTPSRLAPPALREIVACVERSAAALGLEHGPVHAEIRWNARGAWLIEIAPRSIGGLCSRTLRFGEDASLEELILRHALGLDTRGLSLWPGATGVMMIPIPGAGRLMEIEGQDAARAVPGVDDVRITIPIGGELVPWPEGSRYLGFIFARAREPDAVERALRDAHARLRFVVQPFTATEQPAGARDMTW